MSFAERQIWIGEFLSTGESEKIVNAIHNWEAETKLSFVLSQKNKTKQKKVGTVWLLLRRWRVGKNTFKEVLLELKSNDV